MSSVELTLVLTEHKPRRIEGNCFLIPAIFLNQVCGSQGFLSLSRSQTQNSTTDGAGMNETFQSTKSDASLLCPQVCPPFLLDPPSFLPSFPWVHLCARRTQAKLSRPKRPLCFALHQISAKTATRHMHVDKSAGRRRCGSTPGFTPPFSLGSILKFNH